MSCNHDDNHSHGHKHHHHGHDCSHEHHHDCGHDDHHHHHGEHCNHDHTPFNERLMTAPTVAIIGLGLMGASFAAALKQGAASGHITGFDTDPAALRFCVERDLIDLGADSAAAAVEDADVVVLAVPLAALADTTKAIAPHLKDGAVITDISSVKRDAVANIAPHLPEHSILVPGHPIAGGSTHGAAASHAGLFDGKLVVLTPEKGKTPSHAIAAVARLWESAGAHAERMSAENHDIIYGYVSHLPQLLAYAACQTLADETFPAGEIPESFHRFIRLGSSDPVLWTDIVTANQEPVRHALAHALATLEHMAQEFTAGESHGAVSEDNPHVVTRYFPLLAAGAAISVVNQFEMQNNLRLANYSGTGLRDFTAPVSSDPSQDLEAISHCYAHVARCLKRFIDTLHDLYNTLGDPTVTGKKQLLETLQHFQQQHVLLEKRLAQHAVQ